MTEQTISVPLSLSPRRVSPGWHFRWGISNANSFTFVGVEWCKLVNGVTLWYGAGRLFVGYVSFWKE